jgi:urease accessory protein
VNAELRVTVADGRVVELAAPPPLGAKMLPGPTLMLIGTAASLLEGDRLRLRIRVGPGQHLAVRSVAAQLAQPCLEGGSTGLEVDAVVGAGGWLDWRPEPLLVCAGGRHGSTGRLDLGPGAGACWVDEVMLGRTGEDPGAAKLATTLRVDLDGRPLLRDGLDTATCGFAGPAVVGSSRYIGTATLLGSPGLPAWVHAPPAWDHAATLLGSAADGQADGDADATAWSELAGPGRLTRVLDPDPLRGRAELARRLCRCPTRPAVVELRAT